MRISELANHPVIVAVIDDDEAVRDSLAVMLEADGFAVKVYPSGEAFFAGIDPSSKFNECCVVLDLQMSGMDGFEVLSRLADLAPRMPVVMVSARADDRNREKAIALGACEMLAKPVDCDDISTAIRVAIRRRAAHQTDYP